MSRWVTLECERAHYVSRGRTVILCDRLPSPVTLVVKLAQGMPSEGPRPQGSGASAPASPVLEEDAPNPSSSPAAGR